MKKSLKILFGVLLVVAVAVCVVFFVLKEDKTKNASKNGKEEMTSEQKN